MSETDSNDSDSSSDSDGLLYMGLLSDAAVNAILNNALIMFNMGEMLYLASPAVQ